MLVGLFWVHFGRMVLFWIEYRRNDIVVCDFYRGILSVLGVVWCRVGVEWRKFAISHGNRFFYFGVLGRVWYVVSRGCFWPVSGCFRRCIIYNV